MALDPHVSYLAKVHLTLSTAENIQIEVTVEIHHFQWSAFVIDGF